MGIFIVQQLYRFEGGQDWIELQRWHKIQRPVDLCCNSEEMGYKKYNIIPDAY